MNIREWALVAFTLLMQTSVGVLLVVTVLHSLGGRNSMHASARAFDVPAFVAAAAAALALVASLGHLGNPQQAWLAVTNARASWLSREIVLASVFAACSVAVAVSFSRSPSAPVREAACLLAASVGIAAIYAMSRLYMIPAQPAWNGLITPATFFATTILFGLAVVIVTAPQGALSKEGLRLAVIGAVVVLAVQLLLVRGQVAAIPAEPAAAISAASIGQAAGWLVAARTAAGLVAIVLLLGVLKGGLAGWSPLMLNRASLVLIALSEICGRVLFYASSARLGPV